MSEREHRVGEAVAWYFQATEAGALPDPAAFLARFPDLRPELESFLADKGAFDQAAGPPAPIQTDPDATVPPSANNDTTTLPPATADWNATTPRANSNPALDPGMSLASIRNFGDYELLSEIARGGMGVVFRARQVSLNREVALKMILTGQLASSADVIRFRAEAEAAANLDHPNVLPIYEVGEHQGQQYFAMKLVPGGSLTGKVATWVHDPKAAVGVFVKVCRAVEFAHKRGILHRDLKPGNILLDRDGTPFVTDFGLAKKVDADSNLTQSGAIVGTPSYMPPEQARAEKQLTTAADVYALGAILYELLTGRPPFRGPTVLDTILQVLEKDAADPRAVNPKADRDLSVIALKCLEKNPTKRYESAGALADDLDRWARGEPILAREVTRRERAVKWVRRNPVVASLTATIAGLVGVAVVGSVLAAVSFADLAEKERIAGAHERESALAAAAAQRVAEASEEESRRHLGLLNLNNGHRLADAGDLYGALLWWAEAWRQDPHDDRRAAAYRLRLASYAQSAPRLAHVWFPAGAPSLAALSPNGRRLLFRLDARQVQVVETATGRSLPGPLTHSGLVTRAVFSPDGSRVLTVTEDEKAIRRAVQLWDADTGKPVTGPVQQALRVIDAAFTADGRRVLTLAARPQQEPGLGGLFIDPDAGKADTAGGVEVRAFDATTGAADGAALELRFDGLLRQCAFGGSGHVLTVAELPPGPNGEVIEARLWNANGQPVGAGVRLDALPAHVAFSPDGQQVIAIGKKQTRIWSVAGGAAVLINHTEPPPPRSGSRDPRTTADALRETFDALTRPIDLVEYAESSRDGRLVLTCSPADNTVRVWDAATRKLMLDPVVHDAALRHAAFSSDGRRFVTVSDAAVRVWDIATGDPLTPPLTHERRLDRAAFSADGRFLLAVGANEVQLWDLEPVTSELIPLPAGEEAADCVIDGEQSAVLTMREKSARVWDAEGRPLTPPLEHAGFVRQAHFSPDGRRVVTVSGPNFGGPNSARVWDAATGAALTPPLEQKQGIFRASLSPDGRRLVVTGVTGRYFPTNALAVWDIDAAHAVSLPETAREGDEVFGPGGDRWLTVVPDAVRAWSLTTGQPLGPPLKVGPVKHVAFSPDGNRVTTWGDLTKALRVSDVTTGKQVGSDLPAGADVRSAAFSADGGQLLIVTQTEVRVWGVETGRRLAPPLVLPPDIWHAAFTNDGRSVLTDNVDARFLWPRARLWGATTGQPLTPLLAFGDKKPRDDATGRGGKRFAVGADGRRLIAVADGRAWHAENRSAASPDEARVQTQILSGRRINEAGTPVYLSVEEFRKLWEANRVQSLK